MCVPMIASGEEHIIVATPVMTPSCLESDPELGEEMRNYQPEEVVGEELGQEEIQGTEEMTQQAEAEAPT